MIPPMVGRELIGRSDMGNSSQQKMIGRSLRRLEDARFLTGRGRYVDDIAVADCLYGHVLRSPHAHARHQADRRFAGGVARRRARGLHPCRPSSRGAGPHAVPGGGEADDRAAAAGAGRWPRAPCRRSGGLRRRRQRGGSARGGRADRGRLRGARRRGRRHRGTRAPTRRRSGPRRRAISPITSSAATPTRWRRRWPRPRTSSRSR